MKRLIYYLNPMAHLGERKYSFLFPFVFNFLVCVLSEVYCYGIAKNPMAVGSYIIIVNGVLIIYFAFREGIIGGLIAALFSIAYYFYIVYTRHYHGFQFVSSIETIFTLALLYLFLSFIIGWLKQQIDKLIEIQLEERKRLETIIQQLPVGVIISDSKGKITHINKQLDKILGIKLPIGFHIGTDTVTKIKINDKAVIPQKAPSFLARTSGKPVIGYKILYENKDKKKRYIQIDSAPIHNSKKKIIATATIISDITQQKELEKQKEGFLSMASHELKTPITSLKMFIDLQKKQLALKNEAKATYYNERIGDQANRLKELTNDLLDVSRIQTGKLHFTREEFDLLEVIQDTVEGLQGTTKQHQITITTRGRHIVIGDRYRIYQVLVNLIANAIKYSPQGKKIIIRIKNLNKRVIVGVQDFGIGIDKDEQKKIFDRLYQITDSQEKTFPGLGLGLYISKEIIERHRGRLWVESSKGKGSTFFFSLPLYNKKR